PEGRKHLVAAGLAQVVEYLTNFCFTPEQIAYLRTVPQLANASAEFFDYLANVRFMGDLFAMQEGTPFLPGEPILTLRAPIVEAQLVETFIVATCAFQSMIATKAQLVVDAAGGKPVVEFGSRRAHSPEAAVLGARAAYIGGCVGSSNVEAGFRYGVPVFGTCAHSWVMSFAGERKSFEVLQKLLGEQTIYLIDTYDTIEGARTAASLGKPLWGVRLDSGDLIALSREVRKILDEAGLTEARVMASGDLDEQKLRKILASGAPIDSFGVGTELATSADAPNLGAVYKLVEVSVQGIQRFTAKTSEGKPTLPGAKQIFRAPDRDILARTAECGAYEPLLRPVMIGGDVVCEMPTAAEAREYCLSQAQRLSPEHYVKVSKELSMLRENWRPPR
ncbi:MAG TPA: nicotinate phosphoribosyltransferase, partial [Bryobacteraceae bacterium]|nr:nicotinate phosphoribosyltransferase [Bryobacteraceae bacterium]